MKKALILTTVASTIQQFLLPNIDLLKANGYQVFVACNFQDGNTCEDSSIEKLKETLKDMGVAYHHIDIPRGLNDPMCLLRAYRQIKKLVGTHTFKLVHCHTPVAGVLSRLACRAARKKGTKVIYTAHGFHYYRGAPRKNIFYHAAEKICSRYTDVLITINAEDFELAKTLNAKEVLCVNGVGVDLARFAAQLNSAEKQEFCRQKGMPENSKILISIGEINDNKNHLCAVRALSQLKHKDVYYLICGQGYMAEHVAQLARELGVEDRVLLLGYCTNIPDLLSYADIFVFPSFREGLPVSIIEAFAAGLPVVCSNIRGNRDLVTHGQNGYLCEQDDDHAFAIAIDELLSDPDRCCQIGRINQEASRCYDVAVVMKELEKIYLKIIGE